MLTAVLSALPFSASSSVVFQLDGSVIQVDSTTVQTLGEVVSGRVVLPDSFNTLPANQSFGYAHGDPVEIVINYGSFVWDTSRPSVYFVQFAGYQGIDSFGINLLENVNGFHSTEVCPTNCQIQGGYGNGNIGMWDGFGYSVAHIEWTRQEVPEPSSVALLSFALVGLAVSKKRHR